MKTPLPQHRTWQFFLGLLLTCISSLSANAQTLDTKFLSPLLTRAANFETIFETADRRLLVSGNHTLFGATPVKGLVRLESNGTLDSRFATNFTGIASRILNFKNGSYLLVNASNSNQLVHLSSTGQVILNTNIYGVAAIVVLADNSILVYNQWYNEIYKYNSNFVIDATFAGDGELEVDGSVRDMKRQGIKVIVAGSFDEIGGQEYSNIARLNANGSIDTTFDPGAGTENEIGSVTIMADGKILLGNCYIDWFNGYEIFGRMVRLTSNGALDQTFQTGYLGTLGNVFVSSLGKIVASADNKIIRLNSNGSQDVGFPAVQFYGYQSNFNFIQTSSNELIVMNGFVSRNDDALHRFTSKGIRMPFYAALGQPASVDHIAANSTHMVLYGNFSRVNGITRNNWVRVTNGGVVDTRFNVTSDLGSVYEVKAFSTGAVVVKNGNGVVKLDKFGSIDPTFKFAASNSGLQFNGPYGRMEITPDDKILFMSSYWPLGIGKRNSDGSVDATFTEAMVTGSGDYYWQDFDLLPNGKIVFAGYFSSINGTPVPGVVRLNGNGSIDTYNTGGGSDGVIKRVTALNDGSVILEGSFGNFAGNYSPGVVKLNPDGTLNLTFASNYSSHFHPWAYDYITLPFRNGYLKFTYRYDSYYYWSVWMINSDGTGGNVPYPSSVYTGWAPQLASTDNSTIFIGDNEISVNGVRKSLLRITIPADVTSGRMAATRESLLTAFPNPAAHSFSVDTEKEAQVSVYNMNGMLLINTTVKTAEQQIDVTDLKPGRYVIKTIVDGETHVQHLVKD
jgi:uncharacterized delta-60 repeat protein